MPVATAPGSVFVDPQCCSDVPVATAPGSVFVDPHNAEFLTESFPRIHEPQQLSLGLTICCV
jgi:hypothetical protein